MAARTRQPGIEVLEHTSISGAWAGANDAWWGVARVHVKAQDVDHPHLLANELICARLAAAMGLPVLPGEIATHPDGRRCWVTPQIQVGNTSLPPADASQVLKGQPIVSAGMLAFDYWVRNEDRHSGNVLFDARLGIWLIDHDSALAGKSGEGMDQLADATTVAPGFHMFRDEVDTELETIDAAALDLWVKRIRALPVNVIENAIAEAVDRGLIPKSCQKGLQSFLLARRSQLDTILAGTTAKAEQLELSAVGELENS